MKFNFKVLLVVVFLSSHLLGGCASKGVNENDPASLFEDAEKDISNDRYLLALDKLKILKSKFSYSSYGALAQLRIGDVYFLQESYPESAASYETFVELYPKHEKSGYAQFKAGEAYFNDIPSNIARDMKSADSAISAYTNYAKKFPSGEFTAIANEHRALAYEKLATKELEIAQFYSKRKKYDPARIRFQRLIDKYPDSTAATKAKELLKELPGTTSNPQ